MSLAFASARSDLIERSWSVIPYPSSLILHPCIIEIVNDWNEIKAWRKTKRAELIAAREAIAPEQRAAWSARIAASLEQGIPVPAGAVVGFCWPHRSEFDARFVIRRWRDQGATAALPAVV